jgi:hypothetical protein
MWRGQRDAPARRGRARPTPSPGPSLFCSRSRLALSATTRSEHSGLSFNKGRGWVIPLLGSPPVHGPSPVTGTPGGNPGREGVPRPPLAAQGGGNTAATVGDRQGVPNLAGGGGAATGEPDHEHPGAEGEARRAPRPRPRGCGETDCRPAPPGTGWASCAWPGSDSARTPCAGFGSETSISPPVPSPCA